MKRKQEPALHVTAPGNLSAAEPEQDLEALDDSGGSAVVLVEYDEAMERPRAFHALPDWLGERIGRSDILAANPHEGVALYCRACDLLLNGARTGGVCPICGEADRQRVIYLLAEPEDDARP